jgi:hypothetical protein
MSNSSIEHTIETADQINNLISKLVVQLELLRSQALFNEQRAFSGYLVNQITYLKDSRLYAPMPNTLNRISVFGRLSDNLEGMKNK